MAAGQSVEIQDQQQDLIARQYRCTRCKRRIVVYVPATVTCSRCGRVMRQVSES